MAKGLEIKISGIKKLQDKLKSLQTETINECDRAMGDAARKYENLAAERAPINIADLKNGITSFQKGKLDWEVVSRAPYSAYVEFGTKSRVKVPADLQSYAAQFKGKGNGGNASDMYLKILDWVKKKGIGGQFTKSGNLSRSQDSQAGMENAARAIWLSILRHGSKPHPFFFEHREAVLKELRIKLIGAYRNALK